MRRGVGLNARPCNPGLAISGPLSGKPTYVILFLLHQLVWFCYEYTGLRRKVVGVYGLRLKVRRFRVLSASVLHFAVGIWRAWMNPHQQAIVFGSFLRICFEYLFIVGLLASWLSGFLVLSLTCMITWITLTTSILNSHLYANYH